MGNRNIKEIETKGILKTGQKGLYWFWTDLSNDDLSEFTSSESGEIDFREIINRRKSLSYSNKMVTEDGFRLVYNGIGDGLRERILQELRGSSGTTGTLSLNSKGESSNWKVSYIDIDEVDRINDELNDEADEIIYREWIHKLERDWRIEFGWPILCEK